MSRTRRQWFGEHLTGLRRARKLSQRQLAGKLCALSGVQTLTRNEVSRWERGERIPGSWLPVLAQVLDVLLSDLEDAAAYGRGETDEPPVERRATPTTTGAVLPIAPEDQHDDMAAMDSFRVADRQLGGGHLYEAVVRYLNSQMAPRIFGTKSVSSTPETFFAASALTEMAGWMAHDSGQDIQAGQHFEHALSLSRVGSDPALTAHIHASLSHLALQSGEPGKARDLARAGRDVAKVGSFVPMLGARLHAMEARALARLGEAVGSH
ncbi:helix-turn-helix domain-containing protein [Streptomyces profundus]|uniref:helix-turn-helix domain-containing protein n=1 Tax=Streptomyces profundus TaxID=2867410 RepID=UPI001D16DCED|nr:helix-turn-helix transcriptional regulator [Streptomyces sp. MA3_2.13]UED85198.1 helix-turn-helix domain-containing protein [Streptomyces sp. MA3_2.13]